MEVFIWSRSSEKYITQKTIECEVLVNIAKNIPGCIEFQIPENCLSRPRQTSAPNGCYWRRWRHRSLDHCHSKFWGECTYHYDDVAMSLMSSQITSLTIVYSTAYLGADQRKHQSSASLAFVRGIHWGPVNSPHKWPVTRKMFPFDDVIMFMFKIQLYSL